MSRGAEWGRRMLRGMRSAGWCANCGTRKGLEFAHVKSTPLTPNGHGRGMNDRARDIIAHPEAYIFLCRDCHLARDGRNARTMRKLIGKRPRDTADLALSQILGEEAAS